MKQLSNDQINILIAEHCGWTYVIYDKYFGAFGTNPNRVLLIEEDEAIPDYVKDLNAMHEAEKTLTYQQRVAYMNILLETPGCVFATATQRAEAFLKVIG
jgi:hypothetical protein